VLTELRRAAPARVAGAPPWWLVGVFGLVLLYTTLDVANHGPLTHLDGSVSRRMLDWGLRDNDGAKPFLKALVMFGNRTPVLYVSIPVIVYLTWRSRSSESVLRFVIALAALIVVVYALKHAVDRYPPVLATDQVNHPDSYPSGHLANSVLIWGTVSWCAIRVGAPARLILVLRAIRIVAPIAVVVGMTLLDYHWVCDLIGGACAGALLLPVVLHPAWAEVATRIDRRLPRSRHTPFPPA